MDVKAVLDQFGISTACWGQGKTKTVSHLQKEVDEGESVLVENAGSLVRLTTILNLEVYCRVNEKLYRLCEDHQEFRDGRVRKRDLSDCSVAEKVKANELVDKNLVRRAIQEELGVNSFLSIEWTGKEEKEKDSPGFPGLMARFQIHRGVVYLNPEDFNPDGYVEHQEDKSTFFRWSEV